jgi:hypothetical protein
MLKKQSMILSIATVSAALLFVAILSVDSLAIGPPPHRPSLSPKPNLNIVPPGKTKPHNALDQERHATPHGGGHPHSPHSKKCKDIYGNLVPCPTLPGAQVDLTR